MFTARCATPGSSGGRNLDGPLSMLLPLPCTCSMLTRASSDGYQSASIGYPSSRRSSTSSTATPAGVHQEDSGSEGTGSPVPRPSDDLDGQRADAADGHLQLLPGGDRPDAGRGTGE